MRTGMRRPHSRTSDTGLIYRQRVIEELTEKCKAQEGKMEQVKGFDAERRKYDVS